MLDSDDARNPSENTVHQLTGSTPPGEVPAAEFVATDDPFVSLGAAASAVVARTAVRMSERRTDDLAEVSNKLVTLIDKARAAAEHASRLDDRVMVECPYPLESARRSAESLRGDLDRRLPAISDADIAAAERDIATVEDWERRTADLERELGVERAVRKSDNLLGHVETRVAALAGRPATTSLGVAAKAEVAKALEKASLDDTEWALPLSRSIADDVVRLQTIPKAAVFPGQSDAFDRAVARVDRAADALSVAIAARSRPEPPEALFWRTGSDEQWIGAHQRRHFRTGAAWYGEAQTIELLRDASMPEAAARRRDEIVAAFDGWTAATRVADEASGYTAADRENEAAIADLHEIGCSILAAPAATLEGLLLKAKVAAWYFGGAEIVAEDFELCTSKPTAEFASLSITNDLVQMLPRAKAPPQADTALAREVAESYRTFLHFELRFLNLELDGTLEGRGDVRLDNPAAWFHSVEKGVWREAPPPSTRAAMVLNLFGIDWRPIRGLQQEGGTDKAVAAA